MWICGHTKKMTVKFTNTIKRFYNENKRDTFSWGERGEREMEGCLIYIFNFYPTITF